MNQSTTKALPPKNQRIGLVEWSCQLDFIYDNNPGFSAKHSQILSWLLRCGVDKNKVVPLPFSPNLVGKPVNQLGELWQMLEKCLATRIIIPMDYDLLNELTAMLNILHRHAMARHTIVTCADLFPLQHRLSPAAFTLGIAVAYACLSQKLGVLSVTRSSLNQHYQQLPHALQFVTLGGTLDKDPLLPAPHVGEPVIEHILHSADFTAPWKLTEICRKDSHDINSLDLELTSIALKSHGEQFTSPLIVTCGTDCMIDIAQSFEPSLKNIQHVILFTGAITPYSMNNSIYEDAVFNIGFAMQAALLLKPGIYIAMHGEIFTLDKVHKDQKQSRLMTKINSDDD